MGSSKHPPLLPLWARCLGAFGPRYLLELRSLILGGLTLFDSNSPSGCYPVSPLGLWVVYLHSGERVYIPAREVFPQLAMEVFRAVRRHTLAGSGEAIKDVQDIV